jgi:hypothetical protein
MVPEVKTDAIHNNAMKKCYTVDESSHLLFSFNMEMEYLEEAIYRDY